jgi:hypothetical protein
MDFTGADHAAESKLNEAIGKGVTHSPVPKPKHGLGSLEP